MSLMYKPFLYADFSDPQDLESLPDDPKKKPEPGSPGEDDGDNVIEEREGVHYINREILNPGPTTGKPLNPDFENLVNSVMKR
jgi:hypothetical protein